MIIACVDVDYRADHAGAAAVAIGAWPEAKALAEATLRLPGAPAAYVPGELYKRELPALVAVLRKLAAELAVGLVIVDGYVTLGDLPGLGARLREAMPALAVVGVAKTAYAGAVGAREVLRGNSKRPLYVTAAGIGLDDAARGVASMAGDDRLPLVCKRADRLARGA